MKNLEKTVKIISLFKLKRKQILIDKNKHYGKLLWNEKYESETERKRKSGKVEKLKKF